MPNKLFYLIASADGSTWLVADLDSTIEYCRAAALELAEPYWVIYETGGTTRIKNHFADTGTHTDADVAILNNADTWFIQYLANQ